MKARAAGGGGKPTDRDIAARGLQTEARALEAIEGLPAPWRSIITAVYVVGAYWSWWVILGIAAFVVHRYFIERPFVFYLVALFGGLALGGFVAKRAIERALL